MCDESRVTNQTIKMQIMNDKKDREDFRAFTACTPVISLLETTIEAAKTATVGDEFLLSPACSSFERFQNIQQKGKRLWPSRKSISWGCPAASPKMHGSSSRILNQLENKNTTENLSLHGFLRENHEVNEPIKSTSQKGRR